MERREEKCSKGVATLDVERPDAAIASEADGSTAVAQVAPLPTIEISDDDYRTLHLPCDALEESADGEPGK